VRRLLAHLGLLLFVLLTAGCHRGQVRLRASADSDRYVWRDLIQPEQYCADCRALRYEIKPEDSYAKARRHPPDGHLLSTRIYWNRVAESLRTHLTDLCSRHNAAQTTVREFDQRSASLLGTLQELKRKRSVLDAALAEYLAEKTLLASEMPTTTPERAAQARARVEDSRTRAERIVADAKQLVDDLGSLPTAPRPAK
jgi:hypothetical protein